MAKIENEWLLSERFEDSIDSCIERRTAREQNQRIQIALHGAFRLNVLTCEIELNHPVKTNCIDGNRVEIIAQLSRSAARKPNDLRVRNPLTNGRNDSRGRLDAPLPELTRWENPRPGVEDLHRVYTGFELPDEITSRCIDQLVDQPGKILRMVIGEQARGRLIGRTTAGDHVGGNGPGRAAKAKQRYLVW